MKPNLPELASKYDTVKNISSGYLDNYTRHFSHLREQPVKLLELGVYHGGSLLMWNEYFANGHIAGLDINPNPMPSTPERVKFFQGSQGDHALLHSIANKVAPDGFDVIIDDAAHVGTLARSSFQAMFDDHLKHGGIYVIEDWGTGYWGSWPDGQVYDPSVRAPRSPDSRGKLMRTRMTKKVLSALGLGNLSRLAGRYDPDFAVHNFGMVGFVKEIVDFIAWGDITRPDQGNPSLPQPRSRIKEISIYPGQVFVVKA